MVPSKSNLELSNKQLIKVNKMMQRYTSLNKFGTTIKSKGPKTTSKIRQIKRKRAMLSKTGKLEPKKMNNLYLEQLKEKGRTKYQSKKGKSMSRKIQSEIKVVYKPNLTGPSKFTFYNLYFNGDFRYTRNMI